MIAKSMVVTVIDGHQAFVSKSVPSLVHPQAIQEGVASIFVQAMVKQGDTETEYGFVVPEGKDRAIEAAIDALIADNLPPGATMTSWWIY